MREEPADLTQRMLHLRQIPVGSILPARVLRVIAAHILPRSYARGERVMVRGEAIERFTMPIDGTLELTRDGTRVGEVRAPQTLGFLGILARDVGPYDAVASTDVTAFELETDTLLELFEDHFDFLEATLRYLGERLSSDLEELPAEALSLPPVEMGRVPSPRVDLVTRVLLLRKMSAFAAVSVNALAVMARQMKEVRVVPGHRFWSVGDPSDTSLFMLAGTVLCETADGRQFRQGPGTAVGGLEAIGDRKRWASVTAESAVVGLEGRTDHLLDVFETEFAFAMDFVAFLARLQLGLLERKAKLGHAPLDAIRNVSSLHGVRVGA
jgi:CRP-like cAMP-binding protein